MNFLTFDSDFNSKILLLKSQGLVFQSQIYFDDCKELLSSNSLITQISNGQNSENPSLNNSAYKSTTESQSFICNLNAKSKQTVSKNDFDVSRNINDQFDMMKVVSQTFGLQIKIYSTFMGKITSRKIGKNGSTRLYLFMNPKNQFAVLKKAVLSEKRDEPLKDSVLKSSNQNSIDCNNESLSKFAFSSSDEKHHRKTSNSPNRLENNDSCLNDYVRIRSTEFQFDRQQEDAIRYVWNASQQKENKDYFKIKKDYLFKMNDFELNTSSENSLFGFAIES